MKASQISGLATQKCGGGEKVWLGRFFARGKLGRRRQDFGFASAGEGGGGFGRSGIPVSIANFHEPSG
jgi:hypothetical protein